MTAELMKPDARAIIRSSLCFTILFLYMCSVWVMLNSLWMNISVNSMIFVSLLGKITVSINKQYVWFIIIKPLDFTCVAACPGSRLVLCMTEWMHDCYLYFPPNLLMSHLSMLEREVRKENRKAPIWLISSLGNFTIFIWERFITNYFPVGPFVGI